MYETRAAAESSEEISPALDRGGRKSKRLSEPPKRRRTVVAGAVSWSRPELEAYVERDEVLDVAILGIHIVEDDVPAELVDRVAAKYSYRGVLNASPEVRAVLKRKKLSSAPKEPEQPPPSKK
jgi:hypothetical protein